MDDGEDGNHPEPTRYDGRKVEVDGRTFDVPSWISEDALVKGIRSGNPEDPLSSLISLEHIERPDYWFYEESYHAAFLIPEGCSRYLCRSSMSVFSSLDQIQDIRHEVTPDGLLVRLNVTASTDFNDVQSHFYRDDEDGVAALLAGIRRLWEDDELSSEVAERLNDMKSGDHSEIEEWDTYVDRIHTDHGDFIAVVSMYED